MEIIAKTREETVLLGEKIGKSIEGKTVIAFFGGMGMGKTTMIGGIAKGLGFSGYVQSPTFNIVNVYNGTKNIYHFDMYRVNSADDLLSTGFYEYLSDENGVMLIEWSENIESEIPQDAKKITVTEYNGGRKFILEGFDDTFFN